MALPVLASSATTIIAFIPLMFVEGVMGKLIYILPVVVIAAVVAQVRVDARDQVMRQLSLPCVAGHLSILAVQAGLYPRLQFIFGHPGERAQVQRAVFTYYDFSHR